MKHFWCLCLLCLLSPLICRAAYTEQQLDSLRLTDDFVEVSLVISEPAPGLFSSLGHTALRLKCSTFDLDYVYHYVMVEEDSTMAETNAYLLGMFSVAMVAEPIDDYLQKAEEIRRGITEYPLSFTPEQDQHLWQALDEELARGGYMKYEFFQQGCAILIERIVARAIAPSRIDYSACDMRLLVPRYEIIYGALAHAPWNRFGILTALFGRGPEKTYQDHLIMPNDLAKQWQRATINGVTIADKGTEILPFEKYNEQTWITPMFCALCFLLLAVGSLFWRKPYLDWVVLGMQVVMSVTVLLFVCIGFAEISWNWLLVPFNLLPVLAWKWRRYWSLPYAGVLMVWLLIMLCVPHMLVDWTHIVLVIAWITILLKQWLQTRSNFCKKSMNNK